MAAPREERLAGLDCVNEVTAFLQRARNAHPTKGAFQAAEVQLWWNTPHPTDTLGQGIGLLADADARRISICYEPDNEISGHRYTGIGFVPHCRTELLTGPTRSPSGGGLGCGE